MKSNRQRVEEVGRHLVESRKYPSIKDSLGLEVSQQTVFHEILGA